jgi:hypothetical protein
MCASVEADTMCVLVDILADMNPGVVEPWLYMRNLMDDESRQTTLGMLGITNFDFLRQEIERKCNVQLDESELSNLGGGLSVTFDQLTKAVAAKRHRYPHG